MRVELTLSGTSPLVMHNVNLADPNNPVVKEIAAITDKGSKMTDAERLEVSRLEFIGGLYLGKGGPVMPTRNILRCVANAAKIRRLGKDVERALIPTTMEVALRYKGPRDPTGLWDAVEYRYMAAVRVNRGLVMRMRPAFPEWQVTSEWEVLTEILDYRDLKSITETAGLIEGLGDNRRNGYGRFQSQAVEVRDETVSAKAA
jgi:hypothetical protein